jgi:outer membrane protein OmpA-like peptidoglycan-associated protein
MHAGVMKLPPTSWKTMKTTIKHWNKLRAGLFGAVLLSMGSATAGVGTWLDSRALARELGLAGPAVRDEVMVVRPTTTRTGVRKQWLGTKEETVKVYADSRATMPVLFEEGGTQIRRDHADSVRALDAMAAVMRAHPAAKFVLEGHTCDLGGERDNIDLSWARVEAVKAQLIVRWVDPQRLIVLGFGESEAPRHFSEKDRSPATEAARQAYRRVVVRQAAD